MCLPPSVINRGELWLQPNGPEIELFNLGKWCILIVQSYISDKTQTWVSLGLWKLEVKEQRRKDLKTIQDEYEHTSECHRRERGVLHQLVSSLGHTKGIITWHKYQNSVRIKVFKDIDYTMAIATYRKRPPPYMELYHKVVITFRYIVYYVSQAKKYDTVYWPKRDIGTPNDPPLGSLSQ